MIEDGLFDRIQLPDIIYGQHAVPTRAGTIGTRSGRVLGFLDSLRVRVYGKGTHSSTPELGIDPILVASNIVSRLHMVVAREIDFTQPCVVTCGMFQGSTNASIIPDHVNLTVDVRSFDKEIQLAAVDAINRIISGGCRATNSPKEPRILTAASYPPIDNDSDATNSLTATLRNFYGDEATDKVVAMDLGITADDFVLLGHPPGKPPIPYVYWNFGVTPKSEYDKAEKEGPLKNLAFNHNAKFAAEISGVEGIVFASFVTFGV